MLEQDNHSEDPQTDCDRAIRLSAEIFGQLDDAQRQLLEADLQASATLRSERDELRRVADGLSHQHRSLPLPAPAADLQKAVRMRLDEHGSEVPKLAGSSGHDGCDVADPHLGLAKPSQVRTRWSRRRLAGLLAVTAGLVMLVTIPIRQVWQSRRSETVALMPGNRDSAPPPLQEVEVTPVGDVVLSEAVLSTPDPADLEPFGRKIVTTAPGSAQPGAVATPHGEPSNADVFQAGMGGMNMPAGDDSLATGMMMGMGGDGTGGDGATGGSGYGYAGGAVEGKSGMLSGQSGIGGSGTVAVPAQGLLRQMSRDGGARAPASKRRRYDAVDFTELSTMLRSGVVREGQHVPAGPGAGDDRFGDQRRDGDWYFRQQSRLSEATNEQYEVVVENPFVSVSEQALSTFSIDVDTASYANVRRFITQGQLPPIDAVRVEELINYFAYDYAGPHDDHPFATHLEVSECPWQPQHRLVRIGLQGKTIERAKRPGCNLVFLLDVSGSMKDVNKLPLLKQAMKLLVDQLDEDDRVAIVTYASQAGVRLESTVADQRDRIRDAIDGLNADGSTNGGAGIQMAYEQAAAGAIEGGINRVILATDGDLNVGITDDDALVRLIQEQADSDVFLTVLGFGDGNPKDAKLEKLADNGNGVYAYIDSLREARKVLVEQIEGSLVTIAKDVKVKVEFNPAEVQAYRLIGYENRLLTVPEFDDDAKDAGEIGAGHSATALYEIVPAAPAQLAAATSLKYQQPTAPTVPAEQLTDAALTGELLTLSLRYKLPDADESKRLEFPLLNSRQRFSEASMDFRFATAVASFGMLLRNSVHRGDTSLAAIEEIAAAALGSDEQGYRTEFLDLVRRTAALK